MLGSINRAVSDETIFRTCGDLALSALSFPPRA
jgi:hypothetical protein